MKSNHLFFVLFIVLTLALSACGTLVTPPPPVTPTSTPAPTATLNPAEIVQSFWDALNNQEIDTALALVAEDIQVSGPGMEFSGKVQLQANIKTYYPPGTTYVLSDVVVTSDTVTYNWQVFVNNVLRASGTGESMVVKDGKITKWNAT